MPARTRADKPVSELTNKELRQTIRRADQTIREIDRTDASAVVQSGEVDKTLARYEAAIETAERAEAELAWRSTTAMSSRLPLVRQLRDGARKVHPAAPWLDAARRYSAPELAGQTLVAARLDQDDTAELERLVRRKREIATDETAEPLSADERAEWERLLGKAAGDEGLFERKRKDAESKAKLNELREQRHLGKMPRRPAYAEPGSVSLPRFVVHSWLLGDSGLRGNWTIADLGLLCALLAAFWNKDASIIVGGRFEEQDGGLTLVAPGEFHFRGKIAGSSVEPGSGHIRVRAALATLARNRWLVVESSVGETRIRLGERALKLNDGGASG